MKETDLRNLINIARIGNLFERYEIIFNYPAIGAFLANRDSEELCYLRGFLNDLPPIDPRIVENFLVSGFAQNPAQECKAEAPAEPPADAAQADPAEKPVEKAAPEPVQMAPAVPAEKPQAKPAAAPAPAPAPAQDKPAEAPARRRGRPSKNDSAPYTGPIPADFGVLDNAELREFCQKAGVLGKIRKEFGGTKREQMLDWCKAHFASADAAQAEPAEKPAPEPIVDIHEVPCYDAQGADDEETEPLDGWDDDDGATAAAPAPAEGMQADADDDWDL